MKEISFLVPSTVRVAFWVEAEYWDGLGDKQREEFIDCHIGYAAERVEEPFYYQKTKPTACVLVDILHGGITDIQEYCPSE